MIEAVLAGLAQVAIAFLNNYLARADLKDSVRKDIEIEVLKLAVVANEWKARAAAAPGGGAGLHSDGGKISLPGPPPPPQG